MLKDLVKKCRSYRRFFQEVSIPYEDLKDMVDTARLTGCTKNCQGLKFKLISTPEECAKVFPSLLWAGALKDWDGPADGERPSAYVLVLEDLSIGKNLMWDEGIVSQTIMLSAVEKGYGGCMIGSCKRVEILEAVELDPQRYSLALVLLLNRLKSLFSVVRRILLLIFWNRWMVFWIKRGRLCCFAQAADTVHFLPEKTSPSL